MAKLKLPNIDKVFEVIYRYKDREYYLEGEDLKEFFAQLGSASIMTITHGQTFKPLKWKVRNLKDSKKA